MNPVERQRRLLKMIQQVLPREVAETPSASMAAFHLSDEQHSEAVRAVEHLNRNETVTKDDLHTFEAIILPRYRPALFVTANERGEQTFDDPSNPWEHLGQAPFKQLIGNLCRSVGRLDVPAMPAIPYAGTGFVVGTNLMMTNRHVARIFTAGVGAGRLDFLTGREPVVDFRHWKGQTLPAQPLEVRRVILVHPSWDMALLEVDGLDAHHPALTMSVTPPDELAEDDIIVIGYPARDWRNDAKLQDDIFGRVFQVKRLQPGKLKARRHVESFGHLVNSVTHDASTLGGNSGSAVIRLGTDGSAPRVVGLHFAGAYLDANFAVPSFELARDSRVVQAGVTFEQPLPTATQDWAAVWRRVDRQEASTPPPSVGATPPPATRSPPTPLTSGSTVSTPISNTRSPQGVTITLPLHITVSLGQPGDGQLAIAVQQPPAVSGSPAVAIGVTSPQVTARQSGTAIEGAFGGADASIIRQAYARFGEGELHKKAFSWQNALSAACFSHLIYEVPAVVLSTCRDHWKYRSCEFVASSDTECCVAANKKEIVVAFRGTKGVRDWITDLNVISTAAPYGAVHRGFYFAFQAVKSSLERLIARELTDNQRLVLTGHSLGGALASIAAAEWQRDYKIGSVFTFGQPAVGKTDFRSFLNSSVGEVFHRIVNDDDIVARVPPGYVHVGQLYHFNSAGGVSLTGAQESTADDSASDTLTAAEFEELQAFFEAEREGKSLESAQLEAAHLEGWLPSFRDHRLDRYLEKVLRQVP